MLKFWKNLYLFSSQWTILTMLDGHQFISEIWNSYQKAHGINSLTNSIGCYQSLKTSFQLYLLIKLMSWIINRWKDQVVLLESPKFHLYCENGCSPDQQFLHYFTILRTHAWMKMKRSNILTTKKKSSLRNISKPSQTNFHIQLKTWAPRWLMTLKS